MQLLPDQFREFLKLFNDHHVDYLVIGGYAVAYHGHPHLTIDLDLWLAMRPANAQAVTTALATSGFPTEALLPDVLLQPNMTIQLGVAPWRIDLFTTIDGIDFDDCYPRREEIDIEGVIIPFIGSSDLKANKRAAGRLKDLADLDALL